MICEGPEKRLLPSSLHGSRWCHNQHHLTVIIVGRSTIIHCQRQCRRNWIRVLQFNCIRLHCMCTLCGYTIQWIYGKFNGWWCINENLYMVFICWISVTRTHTLIRTYTHNVHACSSFVLQKWNKNRHFDSIA